MRKLLVIVIIAALAYAGYWFVGARTAQNAMATWFDERRAEGWVADYSDLNTAGFPSRFDTTITDLELADPQTGLAYTAPFLQLFALSYRPNHLIAVWPPSQSFATPDAGTVTITSADMRASLKFKPSTSLELDTTNFEGKTLEVTSPQGTTKIGAVQIAARGTATRVNTYDFYASSQNVALPQGLRQQLDPAQLLPAELRDMIIDATLEFDRPWDRFAIEDQRPQPTSIQIKLVDAGWGDITIKATGDLQIDPDGTPTGDLAIKADNWQQILALAETAGILPGRARPLAETMLNAVAGLSGNPNSIDAPLSFKNGFVSLGPLPLGRAPKIQLR
ncbi:DUF2125 domain-containing protein [Algirhabdus cladophorae]|uniref:DUF2125 domain-containing protein n=1 Tax=Algirhabdus cladophorae TaxID=3377108 RepID=UPI003B849355